MKQLFNFLLHAPFTAWIGTLIVLLLMVGIIWLIGLMLIPLLKETRVHEVWIRIKFWWIYQVRIKEYEFSLQALKELEEALMSGHWKNRWFKKFYLRFVRKHIKIEIDEIHSK